ncbi:hypothetical protein BH09ACT5_BH09ACT5_08500 [soil metagenome]
MEARVAPERTSRPGISLILAEVSGALLVCAGAAGGALTAGVLGVFRMMQLNSPFAWGDSADPAPGWLLALWTTVGVLVAAVATLVYTISSRGFVRAPGPLGILLVGLAVGLWMGCSQWGEPQDVGYVRDPDIGSVAWNTSQWLWYNGQWALPALVTVLALAAVLFGRLFRRFAEAARNLGAE